MCGGEIAIARLAYLYFKHECEAGTPFTLAGAKELMRLGICTMAISLGTLVLGQIVYASVNIMFAGVADLEISQYQQISLGFVFLVVSLLLKAGTQQIEQAKQNAATE